ncbi:chemotaxis protein CheX [Myxococcota bacterium]
MGNQFLEGFLGVQFFGEYLIDRWVINREQLLDALAYQMTRNERFGAVAVRKGYLTPVQVDEINRRQRESDQTFGELAVAEGMLNDQQVGEIIRYQRNNNLYLGEALLRLGFITEEVLGRELANFREHQKRFTGDELDLQLSYDSTAIVKTCIDLTRKMFRRVVGTVIKTGRGVVLTPEEEKGREGYAVTVSVTVNGREMVRFLLSVTRDLAVPIATSILRSDASSESEEMIADAVKEFCNFICGNTAARVAHKGIDVEIAPPEQLDRIPEPEDGYKTVAFPVRLVNGGADLRFHVPVAQ